MIPEKAPEHICKSLQDAFIYDRLGMHKDRFRLSYFRDLLFDSAYSALVLFRIQQYFFWRHTLYRDKSRRLVIDKFFTKYYANLMWLIQRINFVLNAGFDASALADVKPGLYLHHCQGTIIGGDTKIGSNCHLFKNILLGEKNGIYPVLKDNVTLYANSVVIGKITLNDNAVVAPNSVVIQDVGENTVVAGIPAQPISKNSKEAL